jgi:hypothetical protein
LEKDRVQIIALVTPIGKQLEPAEDETRHSYTRNATFLRYHPRMRLARLILPTLLLASMQPLLRAQQPTGSVSGHVTCADTQRPARFAQVTLVGVPAATEPPRPDPNATPAQQMAAARASMSAMKFVQGQTDVDGAFTISGVNPGDYYVFASVPGYIQPSNQVEAAIANGADPHKSIPGVPQVHIAPDRAAQAEVSVEHGAAIAGHAQWDDSSPVSRALITLIKPGDEKPKQLPPEFAMLAGMNAVGGGGGLLAFTDDRGDFRIAGLAPGDYLVQAVLTTHSSFAMQGGAMNLAGAMASAQTLTVFAPAAFHKKDAKPITLRAGEEHPGADLSFNLNGLQTVSGTVSSAEDHHHLNSASIKLEDANDKDFTRNSGIDASGNFTLTFVPPGTYTLTVSDASDEAPSTKKPTGFIAFQQTDTLRSYQEAKKTIVVTDSALPGQDFELLPAAKTTQKPDLNQILGGSSPN